MIIDLSALNGGSRRVELSVDGKDLDIGHDQARLIAPVHFTGEVTGDSFRAKVTGKLSAEFEIDCTRCLEPVLYSSPIEFSSEFVSNEHFGSEGEHEIDPQSLSANALDEDHLDLVDVVREQVLLNIPEQVFCREDCKGLCETCGVNRNLHVCNCKIDSIDPRWSALKNLR